MTWPLLVAAYVCLWLGTDVTGPVSEQRRAQGDGSGYRLMRAVTNVLLTLAIISAFWAGRVW